MLSYQLVSLHGLFQHNDSIILAVNLRRVLQRSWQSRYDIVLDLKWFPSLKEDTGQVHPALLMLQAWEGRQSCSVIERPVYYVMVFFQSIFSSRTPLALKKLLAYSN